MRARAEAPWGAAIPEPIFERYVLPPTSLAEPFEPSRAALRARVAPLAAGLAEPGAAAVAINDRLWRELRIEFSHTLPRDPDVAPLATLESRSVTCVSASILLVDALRSMAIPARVVGIPAWPPGPDPAKPQRGYHQWVEIWDGSWRYLGAYDHGELDDDNWFFQRAAATDATLARHRIYAAASVPAAIHFPLPWDRADRSVPARDVTPFYTRRRVVRLELPAGRRAEIAHAGEIVAVTGDGGREVVLAAGERFEWRLLDEAGVARERGELVLGDEATPELRLP